MPRNPELEAAIHADPGNEQAYLVYADWLQQHGDPRGELAVVQAEIAREPTAALRKRQAALFAAHRRQLLGDLPEPGDADDELALFRCTWRSGWMVKAALTELEPDPSLHARLAACESARFLTELRINVLEDRVLHRQIQTHGLPWRLRRLVLDGGQAHRLGFFQADGSHLGDVGAILRLTPELRELELRGDGLELGRLDLPELNALEVKTTWLTESAWSSLAAARCPQLRRLTIDVQGVETPGHVLPLLASSGFPQLEQLALRGVMSPALVEGLMASPMLPGLRRLDLARGRLDGREMRLIYVRRAAFARLEEIDLSGHPLWPAHAGLVSQLIQARR